MGIVNILLFDDDNLSKAVIENYLQDIAFDYQFFQYNIFDENVISSINNQKIIFICINKSNIKLLDSVEKLSSDKNNNFVIISNETSTDFHVKSLRAGAKDFLLKPVVKTNFLTSVQKIYNNQILNKAGVNMSNVYTVVSPESGAGKTFFLVNLAKEIADITKEKVLIVDFNNNVNDISILLDINSKYNTSFIFGNIDAENAQELLSHIEKYKDSSLYIMANGLYTSSLKIPLEKLKLFIEEAKKQFKYIFFDIDPVFDKLNSHLLNVSSSVFCILDVKHNSAEKAKDYFIQNNLYSKVKFIVNKYRQRDAEKLAELETAIEKQVYCKIPQGLMSTSMAMQNGKTLKELNPNMDIVKIYNSLAKNIINKD